MFHWLIQSNQDLRRLAQTVRMICWTIVDWFRCHCRTVTVAQCICCRRRRRYIFVDCNDGESITITAITAMRCILIGNVIQVIVVWQRNVLVLLRLQ